LNLDDPVLDKNERDKEEKEKRKKDFTYCITSYQKIVSRIIYFNIINKNSTFQVKRLQPCI
jgi:hypothetical protein